MNRRLLVIATAPVEQDKLRERVREHSGEEEVDVRVVAPAVELSPLEWLASDEDEAREEAAGVAREAKHAVHPEAQRVEAEVGDTDPLQAIEGALRQFPADEASSSLGRRSGRVGSRKEPRRQRRSASACRSPTSS